VREAVYNSVQHSGSQAVDLQLRVQDSDLTIAIADRGRGFSPDASDAVAEGHYGILGMRERVQRLGGRMDLISSPGAGTTVRLQVRRTGKPTAQ
jgi:signal transduction histidine kinase